MRLNRRQPYSEVVIGEVRLAAVDLDGAVDWVVANIRTECAKLVITPNIHHISVAQHDKAFARVLQAADLLVADGWPVVAASRVLRKPLPTRVPGVDLVQELLFRRSVRARLAILGGPPGAAERLAERASHGHRVVLVDELRRGTWDFQEEVDDLRARLRRSGPSLVLLGIGAPRQEILAAELKDTVSGPIVCCGAAIEMLAGVTPRSPAVFRRLGLEWAFRAAREPRRLLPRYARASSIFARVVALEAARQYKARRSS